MGAVLSASGAGRVRASTAAIFTACSAAYLLALFGIVRWAGIEQADLSTGDEAAHFVNGLLIHDYLVEAAGQNPMAFARAYYLHLPRVSIGHWPPFFYVVEAGYVFVAGRSEGAAQFLQLVIAASVGGVVAAVAGRRYGVAAGLVLGAVVLACPDLLRNAGTVMLDNFVALLMLLSCLAWARFARSRDWRWSAAFGAVSLAAILSKGNALALGLLPPFYCLVSGDWSILRAPKTWIGPVLIVPPVAVWYGLTLRITADGFKYELGGAYFAQALPAYGRALLHLVGPMGIAGYTAGLVCLVARGRRGMPDAIGCSLAAMAPAVACFTVLVPAEITDRYLVPLVAPVAVVALVGFEAGLGRLGARGLRRRTAIALGMLVAGAAVTARLPVVLTLGMDRAAALIRSAPANGPFVLAAGTANGEGGLIASFAAGGDRSVYVIRASKALGSSNFMGSDYRARFESGAEVARWIDGNHIGWIVVEDTPASLQYLHDAQVKALVQALGSGWELVGRAAYRRGEPLVYRRPVAAPTPGEIEVTVGELGATKLIGRY